MSYIEQAFNPLDLNFHAAAFGSADEAHEKPIFFSPAVDAWVVSRYNDATEVLRSPERFSSRDIMSITDLVSPEVSEYFGNFIPMEGTLIGIDEPAHSRLRRVLNHGFTSERINALAPGVLHTVNTNLDAVMQAGHMELQSTISLPMALSTIGNLIGIPAEELHDFRIAVESWEKLALAYFSGMPIEDQMVLAERVMAAHLRINELLEERRHSPKEDLLSDLVAPGVSDDLTPRELLSLIPGLFFAGNQTTSDALGLGLYHLLTQRDRYAELVSDTSRAPLFVEEILRLDGPVFGLWRHVVQDTTIGGTPVPAGTKLFVSFWFADLDNSRFPSPQDFDITRSHPKHHLAFGRGIHYCIGAPVGRLELRIALETIAQRLPGLNLAPGFTPSWRPHFFLRGLDELQLVW